MIAILGRAAPAAEPDRDVDSTASPSVAKATDVPTAPPYSTDYVTVRVRGRVVWMADALQRRFGASTVEEARERTLALEAPDGTLYPIVEDVRGRAFRADERLRGIDVELLARRYAKSTVIKVIRVFQIDGDQMYELDYWCDICAIPMLELKPCDCCQGPIELRRRLVADDEAPPSAGGQPAVATRAP